jgi:hypothetical protein
VLGKDIQRTLEDLADSRAPIPTSLRNRNLEDGGDFFAGRTSPLSRCGIVVRSKARAFAAAFLRIRVPTTTLVSRSRITFLSRVRQVRRELQL